MKKFHIGIDIDNTIADSFPAYVAKFNQYFGMDVALEDVDDFYFLEKNTGVSREKMSGFFDVSVHLNEFQITIDAFEEPKAIIQKWSNKGHCIHYVTVRPESIRTVTKLWLQKHGYWVKGATLNLHDTEGETDIDYKKRIVKKYGINIFIEDKKDIAESIDIPVFLLDRKWNQGQLSKDVTRVTTWEEIDRLLKKS